MDLSSLMMSTVDNVTVLWDELTLIGNCIEYILWGI